MSRYSDGVVTLPLPFAAATRGETLCVENQGRDPISVGGEDFGTTTVDGKSRPYSASITLLAPRKKWTAQIGAISDRIAFARGGLSGVPIAAAIALLTLVGLALAMGATWRLGR